VITDGGRVRFFGHTSCGAALTAKILKRLRFSRRQINLVSSIVNAHLRPVQICAPDELPSERSIYRYFHDCGDAAIETLFFSLADHLATRGPELDVNNWQRHARIVEYILNQHNKQQERVGPAKLISGDDIMKHCGIKPGPTVGRILEGVREAQASGDISSPEEALVLAANLLKPEKNNDRT
jgi:poly(A) polymerase